MSNGDPLVQNPSVSQLSPAQIAPPEQALRQGHRTPESVVPSDELLRGNRSVDISHNGSVYRLQATRLGKLILTK